MKSDLASQAAGSSQAGQEAGGEGLDSSAPYISLWRGRCKKKRISLCKKKNKKKRKIGSLPCACNCLMPGHSLCCFRKIIMYISFRKEKEQASEKRKKEKERLVKSVCLLSLLSLGWGMGWEEKPATAPYLEKNGHETICLCYASQQPIWQGRLAWATCGSWKQEGGSMSSPLKKQQKPLARRRAAAGVGTCRIAPAWRSDRWSETVVINACRLEMPMPITGTTTEMAMAEAGRPVKKKIIIGRGSQLTGSPSLPT